MEEQFYLGDDQLHPDIILTSPTLDHSIITECKSNSIDRAQIERYSKLSQEDIGLIERGVVGDIDENISPPDYETDICLSSLEDLSSHPIEIPNNFVILHFLHAAYSGFNIWVRSDTTFGPTDLQEIFPINSGEGEYIRTEFYPYDVYPEDHEALVESVLQAIISLALKKREFTLEEVLERSHRYWESIGDKKQEELRTKAKMIIDELAAEELKGHIEQIVDTDEYEWKVIASQIQPIAKRTERFVEKVVSRLDEGTTQTELGEWMEGMETEDNNDDYQFGGPSS
ncbi:hypothetical protein [Halosimplex sp. J119]